MTACPCAQEMVAGLAPRTARRAGLRRRARSSGSIEAVPVATHNQRGIGTLYIGCPEGGDAWIDAPELLRIVESSMSSEIYELMKRPDELAVVAKAHAQPALRRGLRARDDPRRWSRATPTCRDEAFVMARQENLETIHRHNVVAERYGTARRAARRARRAASTRAAT